MKLNSVIIIGNLVKNAETKVLPSGMKKQIFTLAINDDYQKAGTKEWIKRPYFVDCYVVTGKEYRDLTKGKKIIINGKIITKNYEINGVKKKLTAIEVYTLDFMYQKDSSDYETIPAKTTEQKDIQDVDEENLPF